MRKEGEIVCELNERRKGGGREAFHSNGIGLFAHLVSVSTIKFHGSSNMTKTIDLEPLYEIMNEIETMFTIIHQNSTLT